MQKKLKLIFILLFIVSLLFLAKVARGQPLDRGQSVLGLDSLPGFTDISGFPLPPCDILNKIDEDDPDLAGIPLKISKKSFTYYEDRLAVSLSGVIFSSRIKISDQEREFALRLMNVETCETKVITAAKRGSELIVPDGYDIRVVRRASGIEWNGRNTHYDVISPAGNIVLRIAWPQESTETVVKRVKGKNGKYKTVRINQKRFTNILYTPYSNDDLSTPDRIELGVYSTRIVSEGASHLKDRIVSVARMNLIERNVMSRAFPEINAGKITDLTDSAYARLLLIEHMDLTEFIYNKDRSFERVLVILRANRENAFATCNSSKPSRACGGFQFTDRWRRGKRGRKMPGTYSAIATIYPSADLIKAFPDGAFDHVNSAMAAILLHDYNLRVLVDKFGEKITQDAVLLEEALAGCYNGSPKWTHLALKEYFDGKVADWIDSKYLRLETRGYIVKLRYLIQNNLP